MDNLVKGVQCYELFGGIALKNHTFSLTENQVFNLSNSTLIIPHKSLMSLSEQNKFVSSL